jgi:hypothetical protein
MASLHCCTACPFGCSILMGKKHVFIMQPVGMYLRYNADPQWFEVGQPLFKSIL